MRTHLIFVLISIALGVIAGFCVPNNRLAACSHDLFGSYYLCADDWRHAISEFDKTLLHNPSDSYAYENRGEAHLMSRQFIAAQLDYECLLSINPKSAKAHCGLGITKAIFGDSTTAIFEYSRAIALDNKCAPAYYNRSRLLAKIGDASGSIRDRDRATSLELFGRASYEHAVDPRNFLGLAPVLFALAFLVASIHKRRETNPIAFMWLARIWCLTPFVTLVMIVGVSVWRGIAISPAAAISSAASGIAYVLALYAFPFFFYRSIFTTMIRAANWKGSR